MNVDDLMAPIITALCSSGVLGLIAKYFFKRLIADWAEVGDAIKELTKEVHSIKTQLAVHETVIAGSKRNKDDIDKLKEELIVLKMQVQAAWRALDKRKAAN